MRYDYQTLRFNGIRREQYWFYGQRVVLSPGELIRVDVDEAASHVEGWPQSFSYDARADIPPLLDLEKLDSLHGMFGSEDVYIIAGGPSVNLFPIELIKKKNTIAVNYSIKFFPWASVGMWSDQEVDPGKLFNLDSFKGLQLCATRAAYRDAIVYPLTEHGPTDDFKKGVFHPVLTGIQAISAALLMTTGRIFLIGFDMTGTEKTGAHFYDDMSEDTKNNFNYESRPMQNVLKLFDSFAPHAHRIFNFNHNSRIRNFHFVEVDTDGVLP